MIPQKPAGRIAQSVKMDKNSAKTTNVVTKKLNVKEKKTESLKEQFAGRRLLCHASNDISFQTSVRSVGIPRDLKRLFVNKIFVARTANDCIDMLVVSGRRDPFSLASATTVQSLCSLYRLFQLCSKVLGVPLSHVSRTGRKMERTRVNYGYCKWRNGWRVYHPEAQVGTKAGGADDLRLLADDIAVLFLPHDSILSS